MGKLIDGKAIAQKINEETTARVKKMRDSGFAPKLVVILVGDNPASLVYVRQKAKAAERVGIGFVLRHLGEKITASELIAEIKNIQKDKNLSGLILQLPVPDGLYKKEIFSAILPSVDVDFLNEVSMEKVVAGKNDMEPPAPGAAMEILRHLKVKIKGKNATIIGEGELVGKPLSFLLKNAGAKVLTCNKTTKDTAARCRVADILVSCVGKRNLVRADMVKKGAVVIDVGFSFFRGKASGDVNVEEVVKKAAFVTPTPGGVGPVTVALLLKNTLRKAEKIFGLK